MDVWASNKLVMSQPGQDIEQIISKGVNIRDFAISTDPPIRFPIPNERELMRKN